MTKDEALKLALEALEATIDVPCYGGHPKQEAAAAAIKEALAQPDYRAVKTYHEGKPVYVSQTEFPPECKTEAEQTAYAFGWWKALESVRTAQPAHEPDELTIAYMSGLYDGKKKRPWVGLTDEEAQWFYDNCRTPSNLIDMVEARLKEKNT
jgi:hypothetical protein